MLLVNMIWNILWIGLIHWLKRVFMIFLFNLILALLFAFLFGFKLYQNLKTIITATTKDLKMKK